jgi:hypothetical protein
VWGLISPDDFSNFTDFEKFWPIMRTHFVDFNTANKIGDFSPKSDSLTVSELSTLSPSQFPSACLHIIGNIISPEYSSVILNRNVGHRDKGKEKVADVGKKVLKPSYVSVLASHLLEVSSLAMKQVC